MSSTKVKPEKPGKIGKMGGGGGVGRVDLSVSEINASSFLDKAESVSSAPRVSSNPIFLTVAEAAYRLGVRHGTVRRLYASKELIGFRVAATIRITVESLDEYIKTHSNVDMNDRRLSNEGGE